MCQGNIRMRPVANTAEPHEFLPLVIEVTEGKFTADTAQLNIRNCRRVADARLFACFQFRRQAVRIPSGHIGSFESRHVFIADDNILQHFVEGGSQVDIPVCIRRAVMKDIDRLAFIALHHIFVKFVFLPVLQHFRFALWQASLHGEVGLRQIQGAFIIHRLLLSSSWCCPLIWQINLQN